MSKRLPQPAEPKYVRLVVADGELHQLEMAAAESRLSVASFARALVVFAMDLWPEHQEGIKDAAERIAAASPAGRTRPGRPKKGKKK